MADNPNLKCGVKMHQEEEMLQGGFSNIWGIEIKGTEGENSRETEFGCMKCDEWWLISEFI